VLKPLVSALLLIASATTALLASAKFAEAAEECRTTPGPTPPAGSRWYYRVSRADHRRCWFLRANDGSTHFIRRRHSSDDATSGILKEQQTVAQPEIDSSKIERAEGALPVTGTALPEVVAAPAPDATAEYLVPHSIPTISFRRPSPDAQTSLEPVKTARAAELGSAPVGNFTFTLVVLATAATTGSLFVGGGLLLTRLLRRRSQKRAVPSGREQQMPASLDVPAVKAPSIASMLPNKLPFAIVDLTQSLCELRRNLRRPDTSIQRCFSKRAFSNHS
jgi:hypothetical protein